MRRLQRIISCRIEETQRSSADTEKDVSAQLKYNGNKASSQTVEKVVNRSAVKRWSKSRQGGSRIRLDSDRGGTRIGVGLGSVWTRPIRSRESTEKREMAGRVESVVSKIKGQALENCAFSGWNKGRGFGRFFWDVLESGMRVEEDFLNEALQNAVVRAGGC